MKQIELPLLNKIQTAPQIKSYMDCSWIVVVAAAWSNLGDCAESADTCISSILWDITDTAFLMRRGSVYLAVRFKQLSAVQG